MPRPIDRDFFNHCENNFYEDIKELIHAIPMHTVLIVTGDFNAIISKDIYETYPIIVGPLAITRKPSTTDGIFSVIRIFY